MPDQSIRSLRPCTPVLALLLLLSCLIWSGSSALAQTEPSQEASLSVTELEALVETLDDPERREELVANLRTLIDASRATEQGAAAEETNLLGRLSAQIDRAGSQLVSAVQFAVNLPDLWQWIEEQVSDPAARTRWLEVVGKLAAVIAAGLVAEWLIRRALARPREAIERRGAERLLVRIPFLLVRTVLDLLPIAAFAAATYGVLPLLEPSLLARLTTLAIINANVLVRVISVIARMILAPAAPAIRIPHISTETAHYLHIWVRRIASVTIYGYFLLEALRLVAMPFSAYVVLLKLLGLVVTGLLVVFVLQNRESVASFIRGGRGTRRHGALGILRARLADIWHVIAVAYLLGSFIIWALQVDGGFEFLFRATILSALILLGARAITAIVKQAFRRGFAISPELNQRFPGLEEHANRYLPALQMILLTAVYVVAFLGILAAWGLNSFGWATSEAGQELIGSIAKILAVIFIALVIWELVRSSIDRYLSKTDKDGSIIERTARAKTLLPLLQRVAFIFLALITGLIILSEIGIDIGPLLAGAGIIGLAVGFGAQTLVKDVITGIFILVEDHFAVGDVVAVGGKDGIVEAISIRTLRLRDLSGTVHTIPFSEVTSTENLTKDFSYYLMDVGVAYREDTDEVVEVLKEVALEMEQDPVYGPVILPPFEVLGVNAFTERAVIVRCRIKTLPIQQWFVGREFNRRMKKRFDELGIELPVPHRTIYFGEDKSGHAPPARVAMEGTAREIRPNDHLAAAPAIDPPPSSGGAETAEEADEPDRA